MPRLYLCFKIVFNSENNDWVPLILVLFLLQLFWKHGKKNIPHILPADSHSCTSNKYLEQIQYKLSVKQSSLVIHLVIQTSSLTHGYVLFIYFTPPTR